MKVGFIGLGNMGSGMAANLLQAGHALTVYNHTPARAEALVAKGATLAKTPGKAARGDVVITMLADDAAVEGVVFGADGVLAGLQPGSIRSADLHKWCRFLRVSRRTSSSVLDRGRPPPLGL